MYKIIIIAILAFPSLLCAQERLSYQISDSISYNYYLKGDWQQLLKTGKQSIKQGIDYKWLRQRMAYAYFVKKDYYSSIKQYEKALKFDAYDSDTRLYLYYSSINLGNEAAARVYGARLPREIQESLNLEKIKPLASLDFEYSYSSNNSLTRSNPIFLRTGLSTRLGYHLSLYQSASSFKQTFESVSNVRQPEYFALLTWSVTPHIFLNSGYHYLNTSIDGYSFNNNLLYGSLFTTINRYSLGLSGSRLTNNTGKNIKQTNLHCGITLPGRSSVYFKSSISRIFETGNNRTIISGYTGVRIYRGLWAEGNVSHGNLRDYNDNYGLYVYNSLDPTTFRAGITLSLYTVKRITIVGNYMYNTKLVEPDNSTYLQQSFTGGLIWKL
jgi:hypothetical protein